MVGFQVNGEFLDLPDRLTTELARNSPFFQQDGSIVEDYTFSIPFPATPKNRRILGFPYMPENADRLRPAWDAVLYFNGVPQMKGEIRAKRPINQRVITANFVSGVSLIGKDVSVRSLREIINEEVVIHELDITLSLVLFYNGGSTYKISINGRQYNESSLANLVIAINNDPDADFSATSVSSQLTITLDNPGEFNQLLIQTFSDTQWSIPGGSLRPLWLTEYREAYEQFIDEHIGENRLDKKIRFGTYGNTNGFTEGKTLKRWPAVNYINSFGFVGNDLLDGSSPTGQEMDNRTSLAPMLTIKALLEALEVYYGIKINFFALNDEDVIFHPMTIDVPNRMFNDSSLILFRRSFNLSELVPDITVSAFIKSLQIGFNAYVEYDAGARVLNIKHREPFLIQREYEDITDRCSIPEDVQLSIEKGFRIKLITDNRDKSNELDQSADDFIYLEGEREIQAGFGAPGMRGHVLRSDWPQDAALLTVWVNLPEDVNFPLKYARYKESEGLPYLDSRPFLLNSAGGLIDLYWSKSLFFENDPISIKNRWRVTRSDVFQNDWTKRRRIDRVDYVLKNFTVGLLTNGVTQAEAEWIKLPYFSIEGDVEPPATGWRALPSSLRCERESGINTGIAFYDFLEQYFIDSGEGTGQTKINAPADPDYIAPFENFLACPVNFDGYIAGNLYIIITPDLNSDEETVTINGVEYLLRKNRPNSFPYPYVMGPSTQVNILTASNPKPQVFLWTIRVIVGMQTVFTTTRIVGPNNQGPAGTDPINLTYRTVNLAPSLFDPLQVNRIVITVENI